MKKAHTQWIQADNLRKHEVSNNKKNANTLAWVRSFLCVFQRFCPHTSGLCSTMNYAITNHIEWAMEVNNNNFIQKETCRTASIKINRN